MRQQGLQGVRRGNAVRTTVADPKAPCPLDRVNRPFRAERPNERWLSDITCVSTWQGWVCVAFVIDEIRPDGLRCPALEWPTAPGSPS